jgi:hypothetical protein
LINQHFSLILLPMKKLSQEKLEKLSKIIIYLYVVISAIFPAVVLGNLIKQQKYNEASLSILLIVSNFLIIIPVKYSDKKYSRFFLILLSILSWFSFIVSILAMRFFVDLLIFAAALTFLSYRSWKASKNKI